MSVEIPGDYIVTLKNGRIYSCDSSNMAVISGENYLIDELSFQWVVEGLVEGKDNIIFKQKAFLDPKKYKGRVFSLLGGGWSKNLLLPLDDRFNS